MREGVDVHHLDAAQRRDVLATLVTAIDVDGGPTHEQARLLDAVATHVLAVDPAEVTPLGAEAAAAAIASSDVRRLVGEGLVTLELVRRDLVELRHELGVPAPEPGPFATPI